MRLCVRTAMQVAGNANTQTIKLHNMWFDVKIKKNKTKTKTHTIHLVRVWIRIRIRIWSNTRATCFNDRRNLCTIGIFQFNLGVKIFLSFSPFKMALINDSTNYYLSADCSVCACGCALVCFDMCLVSEESHRKYKKKKKMKKILEKQKIQFASSERISSCYSHLACTSSADLLQSFLFRGAFSDWQL